MKSYRVCQQICQYNEFGATQMCLRPDDVACPMEGEKLVKIKDSGERTEFETGAVRDMHAGKGRMDLLPWRGVMEVSKLCEDGAIKYGERNVDKGIPLHSLLDSAARHLAKYINGENDEDHLRAAAWNLLWALEQRFTHPELNDMPWSDYHDGVS